MTQEKTAEMAEDGQHWLLDRLATFASKPFLHMDGRSHDYAELCVAIASAGERLEAVGVLPGQTVLLLSDYSFDAIALFLALMANRNIIVPVTTQVEDEIRERGRQLHVDWICRHPSAGVFERSEDTPVATHALLGRLQDAGRAGLVLFSSGSTGSPKAMVHDLDGLVDRYRSRKGRDLTLLVFLMFDHIGGLHTLFTALSAGSAIVIPGTRDPDTVCELVARYRVVVLPASPTFLNLVLLSGAAQRHDLSSLRIISYGTEPMPEGLLARVKETFPKVHLVQTFGTSETGIVQTSSASSRSTLLRFDDPTIEHRIVDGELWLRSSTQILGYLNHSMESFTDDGWFKTGDLVETADGGYLRIRGRRSEMINVGGQKVLPQEVEAVLAELPALEDCLVYGEPNAITGQIVCAKVVLAAGAERATIRQVVRAHCQGRLDAYKVPVKVSVSATPLFGARFKKSRALGQA